MLNNTLEMVIELVAVDDELTEDVVTAFVVVRPLVLN